MKRLLIMTMLLTMPLVAKATGWTNMPLGTNRHDWNVLRTNGNPFAQLWYACVERYQCFPVGLLSGTVPTEYDIVNTLNVTTGFSVVVTNILQGGVTNTYTNRVPAFKIITITNNLYDKTNLFSSVTVIGTNQNDVCFTNEAYIFLTGEGSISANYSDKNYFETPYYALMLSIAWEGSPGSAGSVKYFINTNLCSNGTYDAYFSRTNSSGVHPAALPRYDAPVLFANELGAEYGYTVSTDTWGVAHGQGNNADVVHFNQHTSERSVQLAQSSYTNPAWAFKSLANLVGTYARTYPTDVLNAYFNVPWKTTSMFPVLTYVTTNAVPVTENVTICGTVCLTNHTTFYTNLSQYVTTNYSETVTLTGTNTLLTNYWFVVTNLACPTSGVTWGDSVMLQYTNGWRFFDTVWDDGDAGVLNHFDPHEINNGDFDQRYKILNAMRWSYGAGSFTGTRTYWSSGWTDSWEHATNACYNASPAVSAVSTPPGQRTIGTSSDSGNYWWAEAESISSFAVGTIPMSGTSRATNYAHAAEYYIAFEPQGVWDDQGQGFGNCGYRTNIPTLTATNIYAFACTSTVAISTADFPANWCPEPAVGTSTQLGYKAVSPPEVLIKFDVPGGFAYTNK